MPNGKAMIIHLIVKLLKKTIEASGCLVTISRSFVTSPGILSTLCDMIF